MKYDLSKKTNRFAKRTLTAFSETLLELLTEEAFETITINQLCERCNYPRSTFYNYFEDIYDLLNYCFDVMQGLLNIERSYELSEEERTMFLFEIIYDYLNEQKEVIKQITKYNPADGVLMSCLWKYMKVQVTAIISECPYSEGLPVSRDILVAHYSNTLQLILEQSFFGKNSISKKEATEAIQFLIGSIEKEKWKK
ncbi:transcriptional regulator, TetR family [Lachnospiraceae bacterium KM106-2]|nr:transcriptional regulator, TetR family [Lachnospiraceae bacterium KM106-2]